MPSDLTPALDAVLDGLPADALRRATASLIEAYRSGAPPTQQVLHDPTTAAAYAAYRMPATHAAVSRALRHATDLAPGLDVASVVDIGGGSTEFVLGDAGGVRAAHSVDVGCVRLTERHLRSDPPPPDEVQAAALQYVRKVSGTTRPSAANQEGFDTAVREVTEVTARLLDALVTTAPPKDREVEAAKARARSAERYGRAG